MAVPGMEPGALPHWNEHDQRDRPRASLSQSAKAPSRLLLSFRTATSRISFDFYVDDHLPRRLVVLVVDVDLDLDRDGDVNMAGER